MSGRCLLTFKRNSSVIFSVKTSHPIISDICFVFPWAPVVFHISYYLICLVISYTIFLNRKDPILYFTVISAYYESAWHVVGVQTLLLIKSLGQIGLWGQGV